jgi:hypothetical protein
MCTYVKVYVTSLYVGKTRSRRQINHTKVLKRKAVVTVTTAFESSFTHYVQKFTYLPVLYVHIAAEELSWYSD